MSLQYFFVFVTNGVLNGHFIRFILHKPQKRYESQHYTANEIFFDVHLSLDNLDNEFEMSGKSLDD